MTKAAITDLKVNSFHSNNTSTFPDQPPTPESMSDVHIVDIRRDKTQLDLKEEIFKFLNPQQGSKKLPTLLLYDEKGLQIFEKVNSKNWFCYNIGSLNHDTRLHISKNISSPMLK